MLPSFPLKMPSKKDPKESLVETEAPAKREDGLPFLSWMPIWQEKVRGERWQLREDRGKRGRKKQPEFLPLHMARKCGPPWVN